MALTDAEVEKCLEVLKALSDAVEKGPWDKSLLLQGIGKKLREALEGFVTDLGLGDFSIESASAEMGSSSLQHAESTEVYVSLYQAQGANIQRWVTILTAITQLSVTRPTYKNETDVKASIRAKDFQVNDAYVAVKIRKDDILQPIEGKIPVDRFGRELLVLKENVIRPENISRFVHVSGEYRLIKGMLVKQ